jgi:hypothetical protein
MVKLTTLCLNPFILVYLFDVTDERVWNYRKWDV